jgi:hypothetical protein
VAAQQAVVRPLVALLEPPEPAAVGLRLAQPSLWLLVSIQE